MRKSTDLLNFSHLAGLHGVQEDLANRYFTITVPSLLLPANGLRGLR